MMPLGDDNSLRKSFPVMTYALILINIVFFFLEMSGGEEFIQKWAFIPTRFRENPYNEFITVFTSMFMHAGFLHLAGNMLYLWIFGDNVEDRFGKVKYLVFYLLCGVSATFAQLWFTPSSSIPNVGASGAIAGILGAYILLLPNSKVKVLLGQTVNALPAYLVIGFWFLLQFMGGVTATNEADVGGVAYMAHVGGFVTGLVLAFIFKGSAETPGLT